MGVFDPTLVGSIQDVGGDPIWLGSNKDVFVLEDYVYLTGNRSLVVIDISNFAYPVWKGSYRNTDIVGSAGRLYVKGNYAYMTDSSYDRFHVFDISDPENPTPAGMLTDGDDDFLNGASGLDVSGDYAYVGAADNFTVIDISDPENPTLYGRINDEDILSGISECRVSGNYAYICNTSKNLFIVIDISDPENPEILDSITVTLANYFVIFENYAYISGNQIYIVDISDPAEMSIIGSLSGLTATGMRISNTGEVLFLSTYGNDSVYLIDVRDKENPRLIGTYTNSLLLDGLWGIDIKETLLRTCIYVTSTRLAIEYFVILSVPRILYAPTLPIKNVPNKLLLQWTQVIGASWYKVYYSEEEDVSSSNGILLDQVWGITSAFFNINNINRRYDTTYYFTVVAGEGANISLSVDSNIVNGEILSTAIIAGGITGEGEIMQELQKNLTYRLNIASDVNQRAEEAKFWSDTELLWAINEGYLDFVRRTECLQRFETISLVADQIEYDLPSDCIKLLWVGDGVKNLHGQSLDYMDMLDDGWMERSGEPAYFVQELGGLKKIQLYETPETSGISTFTADTNHTEADADTGIIIVLEDASTEITATADSNHSEADEDTGMIVVFTGESVLLPVQSETGAYFKLDQQTANIMILFAYEPQEFNNLTEAKTPAFLAAYHIAIVHFALSELYLKEGETQNIPLSNFYRMLYEEAVENKLATSHVSNLKMTWAGGDRLANLPSDPHLPYDTYPAYRR